MTSPKACAHMREHISESHDFRLTEFLHDIVSHRLGEERLDGLDAVFLPVLLTWPCLCAAQTPKEKRQKKTAQVLSTACFLKE